MTRPYGPAEVVDHPASTLADVPGMLRKLADQVESEEVVADAVVCVIAGPSLLQVRGFGRVDGLQAMAYLALAQARMCSGTLAQIDGDG